VTHQGSVKPQAGELGIDAADVLQAPCLVSARGMQTPRSLWALDACSSQMPSMHTVIRVR
jgi:hypothetical protein